MHPIASRFWSSHVGRVVGVLWISNLASRGPTGVLLALELRMNSRNSLILFWTVNSHMA